MIGDVDGRLCILTDDMIDTGGTIVSAAEILLDRGATEVWAMATHGVLSGPRDRPPEELGDRAHRAHQHAAAAAREADPADRGALGRRHHRRGVVSAVFDDTSVSEIFDGENLA